MELLSGYDVLPQDSTRQPIDCRPVPPAEWHNTRMLLSHNCQHMPLLVDVNVGSSRWEY